MPAELNGEALVTDDVRTIAVGAAADGWDATSGTTADAAWSGTGAGSKIAILKNIAGGTGGTDPASPVVANQGTGSRGWLATIAGLLQLGAQTSAKSASIVPATDVANLEPAGTAITASGGLPAGGKGFTGWLSTIAYYLASKLGVKAAAGDLADGALATLGSTTDAPASATLTVAAVSGMAVQKGLFNLFVAGLARVGLVAGAVYQSSTGSSLGAGGAIGLATIQCGTSNTSLYFATIKAAVLNPPSAGYIKPQYSNDGNNWADAGAQMPCSANAVTVVSSPVFGMYARWVYVNGATALTAAVTVLSEGTAV